jgi:hypothetical protein
MALGRVGLAKSFLGQVAEGESYESNLLVEYIIARIKR